MSLPAIEVIPRRHWIRIALAFVVLGAAALWYAPRVDPFSWQAQGIWCLTGLAVAAPTLLRALRAGFAVVLTDHRMVFLAAFSLYFLLGAALPAYGPEWQVQSSLNYYPTDPGAAMKVNGLNALGFGVALLTSALSRGRWLGKQAHKVAERAGRLRPHVVVGLFLALGAAATSYRIPFDLGFRPGVVSGVVRTLGQLSLVAIFMATSSRGTYERMLRWLGVTLTVVLVFVGAMQFMKSEALMPLVALTAGLALRFGSRRILPIGLALLVAAFVTLGNLVDYGRSIVSNSSRPSSLADRWSYLKEGWESARDRDESQRYGYWSRICYIPTQVASIDLYDQADGGNGLQILPWVLVPRALAPNKPSMTSMFTELNMKITGYDGSSNAPGIFVSGYYHGGWWGALLASVLCGWILAQTSAVARAVYAHQAAIMVPFSLLGMLIAFRIDGDFIPDYAGVFMYILYPLLIAALLIPAKRSRQGAEAGQPQRTPC